RAQSAEPEPVQADEVIEEATTDVSAPKKTKRVDEVASTSVSTIRRNLKEMTTTDETNVEGGRIPTSQEENEGTMKPNGEEDAESVDTPMSQYNEKKRLIIGSTYDGAGNDDEVSAQDHESGKENEGASPRKRSRDTPESPKSPVSKDSSAGNTGSAVFTQFSGKGDDDGWGEFAEEPEKKEEPLKTKEECKEKPKYAFGTTSGFGTKGWATTNATAPAPKKASGTKSSFGGFGTTAFGGFSSNIASVPSSASSTASPSFSSFAKASVSPFVLAAANTTTNALSLPSQTSSSPSSSPTASIEGVGKDKQQADKNHKISGGVFEDMIGTDEESGAHDTDTLSATKPVKFGDGLKLKSSIVRPKEVKTGEENETTIYQTKAKLLVLDTATGNWKERGSGTMRINTAENAEKRSVLTRLVMRADSVFRVILNVQIFAGMQVFIMQEKFVRFAGFETEIKEDGETEQKLVNYALRVSNAAAAEELRNQIASCVPPASTD
ncbi:hypothetical protein DFQ28_006134, partial [Apophysomyces sp. BC1034]